MVMSFAMMRKKGRSELRGMQSFMVTLPNGRYLSNISVQGQQLYKIGWWHSSCSKPSWITLYGFCSNPTTWLLNTVHSAWVPPDPQSPPLFPHQPLTGHPMELRWTSLRAFASPFSQCAIRVLALYHGIPLYHQDSIICPSRVHAGTIPLCENPSTLLMLLFHQEGEG